jgi:hypothetical protein
MFQRNIFKFPILLLKSIRPFSDVLFNVPRLRDNHEIITHLTTRQKNSGKFLDFSLEKDQTFLTLTLLQTLLFHFTNTMALLFDAIQIIRDTFLALF